MEYDILVYCRGSRYDEKVARKLYKALKTYRLPGYVAGDKRRVQGVYFSSGRNKYDTEALKHSAHLLVICSPQAFTFRETVLEAIDTFKASGGADVVLVVTAGDPKVYTDTFLKDMNEPLAANVTAASFIKALALLRVEKLRILAPILGLGFDDLKQRHREQFMRKTLMFIAAVITAVLILGATGTYLWLEADKARNKAVKAREMAEKQTEIAKRQFSLSSEAFYNIIINVRNDFEEAAEMKQTVQSALDEIIEELKGIKGYERLLEELIENPAGPQ